MDLGDCIIFRLKPITIIMYHSVNAVTDRYSISSQTFEKQIRFIYEHYPIIRLSDIKTIIRQPVERRTVVITFDDAFNDFYEYAFPVLEKFGAPATLFVPTGFLGAINQWDYPYNRCSKKTIMSEAQLREIRQSKLVDIGAHTVNHFRMARLKREEMRYEAVTSKRTLEDKLSTKITMFAYPYGKMFDYSPKTTEILAEAGYEIAVTARWGTWNSHKNLLRLRRISFMETDSLNKVKAKIDGFYDWMSLAK